MTRSRKPFARRIAAAASLPLAAMLAFAPRPAHAGQPSLAGTWQVSVTLVDCTNGTPLAPVFTSLLGFAGDGTETETTNNPLLEVGQRSPGFGIWTRTGTSSFHMHTYALILFASNGGPHPLPAGSQQITQDIALAGNAWTSKATTQYFDMSGNQVASGCATAAATRLK